MKNQLQPKVQPQLIAKCQIGVPVTSLAEEEDNGVPLKFFLPMGVNDVVPK
jgi:hypothetical protein